MASAVDPIVMPAARSCNWSRRLKKPCVPHQPQCKAYRRYSTLQLRAIPDGGWTALAEGDSIPAEEDPDFKAAVNEICNKMLKAMLQEDILKTRALKEEINELGAYFAKQGDLKAALFFYVLIQMTTHVVPKEVSGLEGMYKVAFEKLYIMLEESGWVLQPEGVEQQVEEGEEEGDAEEQQQQQQGASEVR